MTLSENTSITIKISSIVAAVAIVGAGAIRLFVDEQDIANNKARVRSLEHYCYAKFFPDETWSKNYLATHTWSDP